MKKEHLILLFIFLISLAFRAYFVFQTPNFSTDAYFHIRHVNYITENFKLLIFDPLSYGGKYVINGVLFHYLLAFFNLFLPQWFTFKVIPFTVISLLAIVVYKISSMITNNKNAALLAAFMSIFIPISITETLNKISLYPLTLIIIFSMIYLLIEIKGNILYFTVLAFILPLLDPLSFILAVALIIYMLLLYLDSQSISKIRREAIIFAIFLIILVNFLLFKKAFLQSGLEAIWQNVPKELLVTYFKDINILETIYSIGIIPLLFGAIGLTFGLFREKQQSAYLISSFIVTDFLLLILKLISFNMGMLLLGLLLTIISALAFAKFDAYFSITKFVKYKKLIAAIFVLLIFFSLVIPSYFSASEIISDAVTNDEVEAMQWFKANTPETTTIIADISEGYLITSLAERRNVADENFLLAKERYSDVVNFFKTESLVQAVDILHKYKVDYIYLSKRTKEKHNKEELIYLRDENCFKRLYQNKDSEIYAVLC